MIQRKRGSGQPLGNEVRHRLERTFDFDFSTVRVHTDAEAGRLSRGLDAKAFTTGRDIFFDHGAYQPDNFRGQKLLAHESTHVVQQRGVASSKLVLGEPEDQYEREADAISTNFAAAPDQLKSADSLAASLGGARPAVTPIGVTPVKSSSTSLVQRDKNEDKKKEKPVGAKPVTTWAGEFTAPTFNVGTSSTNVYGVDIVISFMPNKSVDAESIALVQTAQGFDSSIENHEDPLDDVPQPGTVKTPKAQEVFKNRLVGDIGDPNFGKHIDQLPESRTPLANTTVDANSMDLAKSVPDQDYSSAGQKIHTQFGFRTDEKGVQAATTGDTPRLTLPASASGSQHFETTALAIDGVQKGTYYGSVVWGWSKKVGETSANPIAFEKSTDAAPSSGFFAATKAWNASKNTEDKQSIPLSTSTNKVLSATSELVDSPGKQAKTVARLDKGTTVETFEDASHPEWVKVIVTAQDSKGKIGWIKASQLTDPSPNIMPKKGR
jgi:Domain of unknown function (DUF4157)